MWTCSERRGDVAREPPAGPRAVAALGVADRGPRVDAARRGHALAPIVAGVSLPSGSRTARSERVALPLVALSLVLCRCCVWRAARVGAGLGARADAADRTAIAMGVGLAGHRRAGLLNLGSRWSDSWFHAAVFNEILRAGVPVQFPHFAGGPLPYPWFFHVPWSPAARWCTRTRSS